MCKNVLTFARFSVCVCVCMCVRAHIRMFNWCVCVCVCMCVRAHTRMFQCVCIEVK